MHRGQRRQQRVGGETNDALNLSVESPAEMGLFGDDAREDDPEDRWSDADEPYDQQHDPLSEP